MVLGDYIGDADATARAEDAVDLAQDARLVRREVDDAVRDDDVDGGVRERDVLDLALEEVRVRHAGFSGVSPRELEHFVGHVDAVGKTRRSDALGREQDVDAASGSEIEHDFARAELRDGGWVAAAEAAEDGCLGEFALEFGVVEGRSECVRTGVAAAAVLLATRFAGTAKAGRGVACCGGVALADLVLDRHPSMQLY